MKIRLTMVYSREEDGSMAGLDGIVEYMVENWVRYRMDGDRLEYVGCSIGPLLYRKEKRSTVEKIQHIYIGT